MAISQINRVLISVHLAEVNRTRCLHRSNPLELKQLRYFLAIAEEEHFGRAAQRLRVAQPALTRQMHKLEEELQVGLFDRLPRGIRVSAAGRALQEDARRVLADVAQVTRHVQLVGRGKVSVLQLGYIEVAG